MSSNTYHTKEWRQCIRRCIRNQRRAQEKLYRHFFPSMERMVLKYTNDEDEVIDILNNGFMKVFKNLDQYKFQGSFEGWIRKIIYRSISDYFRKSKKDLKFLIFEGEYSVEPSTYMNHAFHYEELMNLVEQLETKKMSVFYMNVIEGYPHREISNMLDINANTSRWYLSEAKKELKKAYCKKYLKGYDEVG